MTQEIQGLLPLVIEGPYTVLMARPDAHTPMQGPLLLLQGGAATFFHTIAPFPMGVKGGQEGLQLRLGLRVSRLEFV